MNAVSDSELRALIKNNYLKFLERIPSDGEIEYHFNQIKTKKISLNDLDSIFQNSQEYIDLKEHKNQNQDLSDEFEQIISNNYNFADISDSSSPEPKSILVTCFNEETKKGGVFFLESNSLKKLYDENACYGIFYDKTNSLLFCVARTMPQIVVFKKINNNFQKLKVSFSNYIFSEDAHGCCVLENKIYLVATEGEQNGQKAKGIVAPGKDHVGKIIVSKIICSNDEIIIKDSQIFNPFDCTHHHHINDLSILNDELYLSSHSYCDKNKNFIKKGAISKLNSSLQSTVLHSKTIHPHSVCFFNDRLYVCASGLASIFSIDISHNSTQLEYKGTNAYIRGLLVTKLYFYFGMSITKSRSESKFYNLESGVLQFNRKTGEVKRIKIPDIYDSIYAIISIN
ncbi:hypothetical protein AAA799P11_00149 [Marine Group I thaumarchaeote SCGC AAA799-P11]|uniref:DUF4214 domain-containing protein n=1 Tax=Marine Group I thaumarchaeote SCGC AAA799-P11 TaxID=1502295 RepID=A0A087S2X4_9ARCH|nr:hypothetical protein AAA799P11_00149 [Marine Group I thaumarchaeote SCGC AAA799-P11]